MAHLTPVKKVPLHLQSAQSRLHIKGGRIVNDDQSFFGDVYIEDGIIKQIGLNLVVPGGSRVIEAQGKLLIPGGIDTSTHLLQSLSGVQSSEGFYNGTKAALVGGTTMIMEHVVPLSGQSLVDTFQKWREQADGAVCCDYGLHVAVPTWNTKVAAEMEVLVKDKGVNSFVLFLAGKGYQLTDDELYESMKRCRDLGGLAMVHAENSHIINAKETEVVAQGITGPEGNELSRPEEGEAEATYRASTLAAQVNCPLLVTSVNSRSTADVISAQRRKGKVVYGEPLAASLGASGTQLYNADWRQAAAYVTIPPLRTDVLTTAYLTDMLANDDLQVTASANCCLSAELKAIGKDDFRLIPAGVNGVEDRMSIVWEKGVVSGKMDPCRFVAVTSTNAAKLFNVYPKKGRIVVGSDADIVVWDPTATRTISAKTHSQVCDVNIFEGLTCHGVPVFVVASGRVVVEPDGVHVIQGMGRYVSMAPSGEYLYARLAKRDQQVARKMEREPYRGPVINLTESVGSLLSSSTPAATSIPTPTAAPAAPALVEKPRSNPIVQQVDTPPANATQPPPGAQQGSGDFHNRPATRGGVRNQQDSSFNFAGSQVDDDRPLRPSTRVLNAPGGRSNTQPW